MLTEPNITRERIQQIIEENWAFVIKNLEFNPGGQASWSYKVTDSNGNTYFFKIHQGAGDILKRFDLTYKLFNLANIEQIAHPIKTKNEQLIVHLDSYPSALFNFISGHNASEKTLTNEQKMAVGELLGRIHKATDLVGGFPLKEDFIYQNLERLKQNILDGEKYLSDTSVYKKKGGELLLSHKHKILERSDALERLGQSLREREIPFVICHGEPHLWNTMVDENGLVYLIDWDDSLLAPKEKDLMMIEDDQLKLQGYRNTVGEFSINSDVMQYYKWEWNISEIDAWSDSIFTSTASATQNEAFVNFLSEVIEELKNS